MYGLFDCFGDIGGLIEFLKLIGFALMGSLPEEKLKAILTNRLFYGTHTSFKVLAQHDTKKVIKRPGNKFKIGVPSYIDWEFLLDAWCCCWCCCKNEKMAEYKHNVEKGYSIFEKNFDIIHSVRKNRLLTFLTFFNSPKGTWI